MENNTEYLLLLTKKQQKEIKKNLETFKIEKARILQSQEESLWKFKQGYLDSYNKRKIRLIKSKCKNDIHEKFVEYCLAPEGYLKEKGQVFACVNGIDEIDEIYYVNISIVTPSMAYIDNIYFSPNGGNDYEWWNDYRPYYFELTIVLNNNELEQFNHQLDTIKKKSKFEEGVFWFKAELKKTSKKKTGNYSGFFHYGGSKTISDEVTITSLNTIDEKIAKALNETYHVVNIYDEDKAKGYLNKLFSKQLQYNVNVINVGQANCIYIKSKNQKTRFFFDLGRPNTGFYDYNAHQYVRNTDLDTGSQILKNLGYLSSCDPECIFISHWHTDHFAAFKDLKDYGVNSTWIIPNIENEKDIKSANRLFKYLKKNKVDIYCLNSTGMIYDNYGIQILSSTCSKKVDPNTRSLILRIKDTIFSADCLYEYWPDDLKNNLSNVKHLVVPHHCSKLSKTQSGKTIEKTIFNNFSKTQGKEAYISVGFNTYGHPNGDHESELSNAGFNINETSGSTAGYAFDIS